MLAEQKEVCEGRYEAGVEISPSLPRSAHVEVEPVTPPAVVPPQRDTQENTESAVHSTTTIRNGLMAPAISRIMLSQKCVHALEDSSWEDLIS